MNVGNRIRMVIAPLALGVTVAAGAARVAEAQTPPSTPPPSQPTQQPTQPSQPAQPTQQPSQPGQTQQPAQPEEPTFSAQAGMLLIQIKPDQTAQFEMLMGRLKEALAKSDKPERKKMAEGWRVYKAAEPMGSNALYIFFADPTAPGDYQNVFRIIAEVFPTEVQDLYAKTKESFVGSGIGRLNLTLLQSFGSGASPTPAAAPASPAAASPPKP
jgi:hypothetical protein